MEVVRIFIAALSAHGLLRVIGLAVALGLLAGAVMDGRGVGRRRAAAAATIGILTMPAIAGWAAAAVPGSAASLAGEIAAATALVGMLVSLSIWVGSAVSCRAALKARTRRAAYERLLQTLLDADGGVLAEQALRAMLSATATERAAASHRP